MQKWELDIVGEGTGNGQKGEAEDERRCGGKNVAWKKGENGFSHEED